MAHHRVDFHSVHAERSIAAKHDDLLVGFCYFGAESERHRDAHASVRSRIDRMARREERNRLACEVQNLVPIDHDDRVAVHEIANFLAQPQRMNRRSVGIEQRLGFLLRFAIIPAQLLDPRRFAALVKGVARLID